MTDELPSYPCQKVVGDGQLCSMPCEPGFVHCPEHRNFSDKRALAQKLELAQERILNKIESALDDAVNMLIHLSTSAESQRDRITAIDRVLTLAGFANMKIESSGPGMIAPEERDRVLMDLIKKYASTPEQLGELKHKIEGGADVIDVESTEVDRGTDAD